MLLLILHRNTGKENNMVILNKADASGGAG
jgi:hypothetical protein